MRPPTAPKLSTSGSVSAKPWFHADPPSNVFPEVLIWVAPQATTKGLEEGKSTCTLPSHSLGPIFAAPLSPEATRTVIPRFWHFQSAVDVIDELTGRLASEPPQLMEITDGLFTVS